MLSVRLIIGWEAPFNERLKRCLARLAIWFKLSSAERIDSCCDQLRSAPPSRRSNLCNKVDRI
jgi:hypothetical protein